MMGAAKGAVPGAFGCWSLELAPVWPLPRRYRMESAPPATAAQPQTGSGPAFRVRISWTSATSAHPRVDDHGGVVRPRLLPDTTRARARSGRRRERVAAHDQALGELTNRVRTEETGLLPLGAVVVREDVLIALEAGHVDRVEQGVRDRRARQERRRGHELLTLVVLGRGPHRRPLERRDAMGEHGRGARGRTGRPDGASGSRIPDRPEGAERVPADRVRPRDGHTVFPRLAGFAGSVWPPSWRTASCVSSSAMRASRSSCSSAGTSGLVPKHSSTAVCSSALTVSVVARCCTSWCRSSLMAVTVMLASSVRIAAVGAGRRAVRAGRQVAETAEQRVGPRDVDQHVAEDGAAQGVEDDLGGLL